MATQTTTELHRLEPDSTAFTAGVRGSHDTSTEPGALPTGVTGREAAMTTNLPSKSRGIIIVAQVSGLLFFGSFCNGIIVVALPSMQSVLGLEEGLLVWPTSIYYLTAGSCLLLAGSVADVAGNKRVNLVGSFLGAVFAGACGLAQTGGQLIAFRALQGVANAIITPSSISIISNNVEEGRPRNMCFASLGFSQPLGFGFGLVLGGVFTDTVGWRPAFYLAGAASLAFFLVSIWALPQDSRSEAGISTWRRVSMGIDWVGLLLASMGLATVSYVLAALSADLNSIHKTSIIVLLIISGFSIPLFIGWMRHQVQSNRTALIPNSLWRNHIFTSSCIMILLTNALANCGELYSSLFFQQIQSTTALQASLRVLPSLISGSLINISTGFFVNRVSVLWTVLVSCALSAVAPLLMALVRTDQVYWENAFIAQVLFPISCDILFTVGLLVISDVFPKNMQALGGAVFNTCAQLGAAIGLSVTQVVASSVTSNSPYADKSSPGALMTGYRVAFWAMFGWMVLVCLVCVGGFRRVGVVGVKQD